MRRLSILMLAVLAAGHVFAQSGEVSQLPEFSTMSAWMYLDQSIRNRSLWQSDDDPIKKELRRLLDQTMEPYDTVRSRLLMQDFRLIPLRKADPVPVDSVVVRWIDDSSFIIDPQGWNLELYLKRVPKLVYRVDFSTLTLSDSLLDENGMLDSVLFTPDTIMVNVIDTAAMLSLEIGLYHYSGGRVTPALSDPAGGRTASLSEDLKQVYYYVPSHTWIAGEGSPLHILKSEQTLDSLQEALNTLLEFTEKRDSTKLMIKDMNGRSTPFWITTGTDDAFRFWVKNYNNDSITLWIGNPATNEISLLLEDDVNFNRMEKEEILHLPSFIEVPERHLHEMTMLEPIPIYWDYELSSAFSLSQTYLSNWAKGGEGSVSGMIDLTAGATYNNRNANAQWINIARLKFGSIRTQEKGFRKNNDQFEIDSKFNRNAWGKIGMSASLYMKHQLAKGYNYPNDTVIVSKFLNPGTITVGLGAEYKPIANTTINIAPLSYKTTFVLDTAHIDQTKHGIDSDKRAKRELGTQIVVNNKFSPMKDLEVINRVRLFSNYLNKPQNIDVDWEMLVEKRINWFFTIRLNLHLIYDDNIHFPVVDADNQPVILPGGEQKKVAKVQFKEFVGLAFSFSF